MSISTIHFCLRPLGTQENKQQEQDAKESATREQADRADSRFGRAGAEGRNEAPPSLKTKGAVAPKSGACVIA